MSEGIGQGDTVKPTLHSRIGSAVTQTLRVPILTIPSETEGSAAFKQRLAALISAHSTHIYIDTSFLMWMTKIGSNSRRELVGWLQQNCTGRVHVPIWAAHEYLKHHVAGTIVSELAAKTKEIAGLIGRTYTYFRPFIDEPFGEGAEDPLTIRADTRAALSVLNRLAAHKPAVETVIPEACLGGDCLHQRGHTRANLRLRASRRHNASRRGPFRWVCSTRLSGPEEEG